MKKTQIIIDSILKMYTVKKMQIIIDSFMNGQFRQMADQIDEYGARDFASDLTEFTGLDWPEKFGILKMYTVLNSK